MRPSKKDFTYPRWKYRTHNMNLSRIRAISEEYGLRPNKRLGQNFLVSAAVRDRIIGAVSPTSSDRVLEIGPGLGALTEMLADRAGRVTAVEIDAGFVRYLRDRFAGRAALRLVHGDILKEELADDFTVIVSNLPYYCATEILFRIARYSAPRAFVMVQKELAGRMAARPGTKLYGALTVTLGLYYEHRLLFNVPRSAFHPRPEVTSSFVMMERRARIPLDGAAIDAFHDLVRSAFWGRRKTIAKALAESPHLRLGRAAADRLLDSAGIDGSRRGEELDRDEFIEVARAFRREG
jgi:16S rRNA (adenine1518-N6/adenine1519-N6)-dimethyltransferase